MPPHARLARARGAQTRHRERMTMTSLAERDHSAHVDAWLLASALEYVAHGWAVIPLHSVRGGTCTCGRLDCSSPGKHPRTGHGSADASSSAPQVQAWWKWWPDSNI